MKFSKVVTESFGKVMNVVVCRSNEMNYVNILFHGCLAVAIRKAMEMIV